MAQAAFWAACAARPNGNIILRRRAQQLHSRPRPGAGWYALGRVSRVLRDRGAPIPEAWLNWPAAQRAASPPPRTMVDIFAECEAQAEAAFQRYLNRTCTRAGARARHGVLSANPIVQRKPPKLRCQARTRAGTACRCKALKN
jgi:hypothetical protein